MDMSKGLYFALALTAYDNERESVLDPSIAEIVFYEYEWGINDNGEVYSFRKELKSHTCSTEELGLATSDGKNSFSQATRSSSQLFTGIRRSFVALTEKMPRYSVIGTQTKHV